MPVEQAMFSLPQQICTVVSDGPGFLLKLSPPIINSMAADTTRHLHSSLTLQDCSQGLGEVGVGKGELEDGWRRGYGGWQTGWWMGGWLNYKQAVLCPTWFICFCLGRTQYNHGYVKTAYLKHKSICLKRRTEPIPAFLDRSPVHHKTNIELNETKMCILAFTSTVNLGLRRKRKEKEGLYCVLYWFMVI